MSDMPSAKRIVARVPAERKTPVISDEGAAPPLRPHEVEREDDETVAGKAGNRPRAHRHVPEYQRQHPIRRAKPPEDKRDRHCGTGESGSVKEVSITVGFKPAPALSHPFHERSR